MPSFHSSFTFILQGTDLMAQKSVNCFMVHSSFLKLVWMLMRMATDYQKHMAIPRGAIHPVDLDISCLPGCTSFIPLPIPLRYIPTKRNPRNFSHKIGAGHAA